MFRSYLKKQRLLFILVAMINGIFAMISVLNGLNVDVVLYGILLTTFVVFGVTVYDYWQYVEKYNTLQTHLTRILLSIEGLPTPKDAIEESYQQLIIALYAEMSAIATRSDVAISDLESNYTIWAHQIKNPIAAIRLVLQTNPSSTNRELLIELIKIEQYVEMALQLVRVNTISTDYVFRACDVDEMIRAVLRKYASIFIAKDLKLNYESLNVTVITDEKWLTFAIEQIISNALKYTQSGHISISLSPNNEIVITDTGIGIDAADLPRVCEKGYTGFNGRFEQTATGIGLYLVKRILTKLGHQLRIESTVGVGTTVYIGLKRVSVLAD